MATTINAGRVRFVSRGTYNNSTQYYLFDLVDYNGSSYIAKENSLGNLPTNTQYWQLIAEKGNTGNTGQTGPVGPTGNGIASITKTGTSGLVDTYTITYTNGNTTTFTVTNGEDANTTEITNLKNENAYLQNVVKQAFTEKTASGTELTIDNTIEARMDLKLKGNTKQQQYSGKNLLNVISNVNDTSNGITFSIEKNGFQLKLNGTSQNSTGIAIGLNKIQLPQTGTYYFVAQIISGSVTNNFGLGINFEKDNSIDLSNSTKSGKVSFSATKTEGYLAIFVNANTSFNNLIINFQVISTDTLDLDFEPYVGGTASPNPDYPQDIKVVTGDNTITISNSDNTEKQELPISLGSLELCKIGNYQDYIYKKDNKWYKHKAINKNTLNGNEKWHFGNTKTNYTNLFTSSFQNDIKIPANNNINSNTLIYCDKFSNNTNAKQQWENDTMSSVTINDGKNITFNIPNSIATTKDKFKTYLISNNITLYYVLATPIEEEIIDTTLITQLDEISQALSKKGTTIISQRNDDLPFNLDVIALTK